MRLDGLHHRLAVGMGLAGLAAAWGGAVLAAPVGLAATLALTGAFFFRPRKANPLLQRGLLVGAGLLAARAGYLVAVSPELRLAGMVDLLVLLLVAEVWKAPERSSDVRLYALSFALLLAATVYRPGLVFAAAFVAYVVLSTVALMVGHLRRMTARYGGAEAAVGVRFLVGTGALSLVTLVISVGVFLAFPRVSRGFAPGGPTFATRIAGFADEVSIGEHGATIAANPEVVLRVEFPEGRPADASRFRWRGRSYDRFDGVRWSHTGNMPRSGPSPTWYERQRAGPRVTQQIYSSLLDSRVLFAVHPLFRVDARSGIRPYVDPAGDVRFYGAVPPSYRAVSGARPPDPAELRERGGGRAPAERFYLQLPSLSPRVRALADSITTGLDTRHDRARAVEAWLQGLDYTRELPATAAETGLEHFLFERRAGHCEYFSTAMVVLLRTVGIPARNVNGFLGGQWNGVGNHLAVTQNEAHSWVEVWQGDLGWVAYDPTPAGGTAAGRADTPWFWPGRILFDGLQHRWNKWVLDYSLGTQLDGFRRAADLLGRSGRRGDWTSAGWIRWLAWLLPIAGTVGVLWLVRAGRTGRSAETRLYLRLRRTFDGDGLGAIPLGAPLAFAAALEDRADPGWEAAASLVRRYVRARFGGDVLSAGEVMAMRDELRVARRAARRG